MEFTVGSILLIALIGASFFRSGDSKETLIRVICIVAIVELMFERGYFLKIGDHETGYGSVCNYILLVVAIWYLIVSRSAINKGQLCRFIASASAIMFGLVLLSVYPPNATGATIDVSWDEILLNGTPRQSFVFSTGLIGQTFRLFSMLLVVSIAYSIFDEKDRAEVIRKTLKYSQVVIIICMVEVISLYGFESNLFRDITNFVLGESKSTYLNLVPRGGGFLLCGFTKEGSHYAFGLAVLLLFYLCFLKEYLSGQATRGKALYFMCLAALLVEFLLSMSFSALYFAACVLLAAMVIVWKRQPVLQGLSIFGFALAFVSVCLVMLPLFSELLRDTYFGFRISGLNDVIISVLDGTWLSAGRSVDWSTKVRLGSAYETLLLLGARPLFGLGYGAATAHSSFGMMLAGCGLIGIACYFGAVYSSLAPKRNKATYWSLVICFILITLFASVNLRPFCECWIVPLLYAFRHVAAMPQFAYSKKHLSLVDAGFYAKGNA